MPRRDETVMEVTYDIKLGEPDWDSTMRVKGTVGMRTAPIDIEFDMAVGEVKLTPEAARDLYNALGTILSSH